MFVVEFSKQVKQKVSGTSLLVQNLEEEVTYTFTVRAQTIDYGPAVSENVTTGPQEGSPVAPRDLILAKTLSSVEMHWLNGPSGRGPILGYYIEAKKRGEYFLLIVDCFCFYFNIDFGMVFYLLLLCLYLLYICKYFIKNVQVLMNIYKKFFFR